MRWPFWLFGAIFLSSLITSCGGGGSNVSPSPAPVPPSPSFTVSLSSNSLTLTQGGTTQTVQVSIAAHDGFTGSVSVTAIGLPVGVTVSPSSLSLTSGVPGAFTFGASSTAGIAQQSSTVEAVSGSLKVDTSLQFNVSGAPVTDPFHMVGGALIHGFYDQSRQLLFATNPGLNELDVISGRDLSVRARVTVPQAWGIDQMADNKTLVIGTAAQEILTVDEDTLAVTQHPVTGIGNTIFTLFYPNVIAVANGKVLIIGQEEGIDSNNILDGGQFLVEWDSTIDTFKIIEPAAGQLSWETDSLARSADHKWAVFSADQFYLYSSDADTLTTVSLASVNPPQNTFGVRGYAINADGTKIAVASADSVTFLDRSFNILGSAQIPSAFQGGRTTVSFSPDGTKLLLQYDLPTAIEVLDANRYTALGYYSADTAPQDSLARLLAPNSEGRALVGTNSGLLEVSLSKPPLPNPSGSVLAGTFCQLPNSTNVPLNTSVQLSILNARAGTSYYLGGQPAPLLSNATQIQIPASSVPGPVEIECIGPDGNAFVRALGFSYGVDAIGVSANLVPPTGNPFVFVFGFGFSPNPFDIPSATIGGQPALKVRSLGDLGFGSLQGAAVQLPNEAAGQSADITVSSADGAGTLANAVTYIPSATIIPSSGLLQVLYDPHRNLLYALKATEVDILNLATLQWQSSFQLPGSGGAANYNVMALSPDGSRLVAASPNGYVGVLDPDNPTTVSVVPTNVIPGFQSGSLVVTKFNKALISGSPNVEVDLATLGVKTISTQFGDLVRTSADGSFLYGVALNVSSGQVFAIDPATYSARSERFGFLFWTDLAVSADGSQFAAIDGAPGAAGDIVGFFDPSLHFLNTNEYPFVSPPDDVQVLGSIFGPKGKVLLVALGDSIEFWDTAKGTLRGRLMTPEELHFLVFPEGPVAPQVALDSIGQTIFAISRSGLTVMKLSQPVDDLPAQPWALAAHSAGKQADLSGGLKGRVAALQGIKEK
jgi:hypothetical protein